jgi:D-alanyl-D-alanine carboxypeptidase
VRELVKTYLSKGRTGTYLETALIPEPERLGAVRVAIAQPVTPKPYPSFRVAELRVAGLSGTPAAPSAVEAANLLGSGTSGNPAAVRPPVGVMDAWLGETHALTTGPVVTGEGDTAASEEATAMENGPEAVNSESEPDTAKTAALPAAQPPMLQPPVAPGWIVQVGAAPSPEGADSLLDAAAGAVAQLQELRPYVQRFEKGGQVFYRARFAGFDALEEARAMCKRLLEAELKCLALLS